MVPALVVIVREALAVTSAAESYVVRTGDGARTVALKELAALLADVYRTTQDRAMGDASKKLGTLVVVNGILRLNFRLHSMRAGQIYVDAVVRMCGGPGVVVSRGAEAPVLPDPELAMDRFPLSQSVTFAYYQGRLLMFDHKFAVADRVLWFALSHCDRRAVKNRWLIMRSLVPVRLFLGKYPSTALLQAHGLVEYVELIQALKRGDVVRFRQQLQLHRDRFVASGVYLLLGKLELFVIRKLFKRVHAIVASDKVPLGTFHRALAVVGVHDYDMDEVECLLGHCIAQGNIKGYASHAMRTLVFSKEDAFPKLS